MKEASPADLGLTYRYTRRTFRRQSAFVTRSVVSSTCLSGDLDFRQHTVAHAGLGPQTTTPTPTIFHRYNAIVTTFQFQTHTHLSPSTPYTPLPTPHTPLPTRHTPLPTPHAPLSTPHTPLPTPQSPQPSARSPHPTLHTPTSNTYTHLSPSTPPPQPIVTNVSNLLFDLD